MRLLLVEDSDGDAYLIRQLLIQERLSLYAIGYHATFLAEALEVLEREEFDAVLLDLNLPDSWGIETVRKVCQRHPSLPVVVLTGLQDEELARGALREGAQDFLAKGELDGRLLVKTVQHARERHALRCRLEQTLAQARDCNAAEACTDPRTGLFTRRMFTELARQQLKVARRNGTALTLFLLDIDGLAAINEAHGKDVGDQAVRDMADLLRRTCRESDILARVGGDKFVALAIDAQDVAAIERRLRTAWYARSEELDRPYSLRYSFGSTTVIPGPDSTPEMLLQQAAQAMLATKQQARAAAGH